MQQKRRRSGLRVAVLAIVGLTLGASLGLLVGWVMWPVKYVDTKVADLAPEHKEDYVVLVAYAHMQDGNLERAAARLRRLDVPNVAQSLSATLDNLISVGRDEADILALAQLADALGITSPQMLAYLATPTPLPTNTALPTPTPTNTTVPTFTALPSDTPTAVPSDTPSPTAAPTETTAPTPTNSPIPPTKTPKPTSTSGPTNTPRPPTPTATPEPAAGPDFVVVEQRMKSLKEDDQHCDRGDHTIYITVVDANGNPLNGLVIHGVWTGEDMISGEKGDGRAELPLWHSGEQFTITGDTAGRGYTSQTTRSLRTDWPTAEDLWNGGYCSCKPFSSFEECKAAAEGHSYLFAYGHYSYVVVFKRSW